MNSFTLPRKQSNNETERCVGSVTKKITKKWKIKREKKYEDEKGDKRSTKNSDEFVGLPKRSPKKVKRK